MQDRNAACSYDPQHGSEWPKAEQTALPVHVFAERETVSEDPVALLIGCRPIGVNARRSRRVAEASISRAASFRRQSPQGAARPIPVAGETCRAVRPTPDLRGVCGASRKK